MRVNISYSVDMDELQEKVWNLIRETSEDLSNLSSELDSLTVKPSNDEMENVNVIDELRKKLASVDNKLADYSAILAGYVRTKAELFLADQEREKQLSGEISPEAQELLDQIKENKDDDGGE